MAGGVCCNDLRGRLQAAFALRLALPWLSSFLLSRSRHSADLKSCCGYAAGAVAFSACRAVFLLGLKRLDLASGR